MPKILLVEDDNNLREIFEMRLKAEGYVTVSAGNGEEALVVAMKEKPDLIIADVMMPKLSGFEMLETLRAAPEMADTKVIMMTALGQPEDRARGERLGVIKYLVKSQVTLEDFVRVVREVLSPDQAAASANTGQPVAPENQGQQQTNSKESEMSMPEDTTPSQTPTPGADDAAGAGNPIGAPQPDSGATFQPSANQASTEQEQSAVQDQINSFVSSQPAAPAEPAADAAAVADSSAGSMAASPAMPEPTSAPSAPADMSMPASPVTPASDTSSPSPTMPAVDSGTEAPSTPPAEASEGSSEASNTL